MPRDVMTGIVLALALAGCGGGEDAATRRVDPVAASSPLVTTTPGVPTGTVAGRGDVPPVPARVATSSIDAMPGAEARAKARRRSAAIADGIPEARRMDVMTVYACWAATGRARPGGMPDEIARVAREMTDRDVVLCGPPAGRAVIRR